MSKFAITAAATMTLCCTMLQAHEAGDWIVRAGYAAVDPRDSSGDLKVAGGSIANTGVGVGGAAALGLTVSYIVAPHFGIELLAATPFSHDLSAKGLGALGVADGTRIGSTKQLPPTVSAQYYFSPPGNEWQPYIGIGINYTVFFDEQLSGAAKNSLGAADLKLDDSWGVAVEAGIDWHVGENWLLNAAVWRTRIRTDASLDTALGRVKTTATIDPWVYMLAVGYRF